MLSFLLSVRSCVSLSSCFISFVSSMVVDGSITVMSKMTLGMG